MGRPADRAQHDEDDHLADCVDLDEEDDDWHDTMCSMGPDGQCGQAGSEWCDFECRTMAAWRAAHPLTRK